MKGVLYGGRLSEESLVRCRGMVFGGKAGIILGQACGKNQERLGGCP